MYRHQLDVYVHWLYVNRSPMIQLMRVCTEFSEQSLQFKIKLHDLYNSYFTVPFNNMWTLKFKAQPTNGFFRYCPSSVRWLLPASDYCWALGIFQHIRPVVWTVLNDLNWLPHARQHLEVERSHQAFDWWLSEKCICRLSFIVCMLLNGVLTSNSHRL